MERQIEALKDYLGKLSKPYVFVDHTEGVLPKRKTYVQLRFSFGKLLSSRNFGGKLGAFRHIHCNFYFWLWISIFGCGFGYLVVDLDFTGNNCTMQVI
jgi:hypothetical protein